MLEGRHRAPLQELVAVLGPRQERAGREDTEPHGHDKAAAVYVVVVGGGGGVSGGVRVRGWGCVRMVVSRRECV